MKTTLLLIPLFLIIFIGACHPLSTPPQITDVTATSSTQPALDSIIKARAIVTPIGTFRCSSDPSSISPNGKWLAVEDAQYGLNRRLLHIISINETQEWILSYLDICGDMCAKHFKEGSFEIIQWSKDEHFLFVLPCSISDGRIPVAGWKGRNLVRVDLLTGKWLITDFGDQISFSHDNEKLAYAQNGIHIRYLRDESEILFKAPGEYNGYGEIVWSPDDQRVAFTAAIGDPTTFYRGGAFAIYIIDIQKGLVSQLPIDEHLCLFPIDWKNDTLTLDQSFLCYQRSGGKWQFNLSKQTLSKASAIP